MSLIFCHHSPPTQYCKSATGVENFFVSDNRYSVGIQIDCNCKMALEALFADLKIDDVSTIVAAVKKDGVEKSGLAANILVLAARCDSKDDVEALAALKTVKTLAEECPEAQAFTKDCLAICKFCFVIDGNHVIILSKTVLTSFSTGI